MQASPSEAPVWHGTTILTVRKGGKVVIGGDGQVSIGQTVIKSNAKKVRKLGKGDVIGGFAGATADAFTLFERLGSKLEQYTGQLSGILLKLAFQPLEQREGVRGGAGKATDDVALAELADLFGVRFDHGLTDRHLPVAANYHSAALADRQNGCAVPDRRLGL